MTFLFQKAQFQKWSFFVCTILALLHTVCIFTNSPKTLENVGEKSKLNLDQKIAHDLDQLLTYKAPKLGPDNNTTACIYIYIYMCVCIYRF